MLNLKLPVQSSYVDPTLPLSIRELEAWLRDLPVADIAATTRRVYQAIVGTNGTRLAADLRLRLMARYAAQVAEIDGTLRPHFVGEPHPLPAANRRIVASLEKLYRQLAVGYEIAASESRDGALVLEAVRDGLAALRDAILVGYLGYQLPSEGLWQEAHELYRYGADSLRDHEPPSAAWDLPYREALLFELTDPNRLAPGEMKLAGVLVPRLARHTRLIAPPAGESAEAAYLVVFAADAGPVESEDFPHATATGARLLDLSATSQALRRCLAAVSAGESHALLEGVELDAAQRRFLERLAGLCARRPRRRHERAFDDAPIDIVRGVSALHAMMRGADEAVDSDEERILLQGDTRAAIAAGQEASYESERWQQLNRSVEGVGLLRSAEGRQRIHVGDLLGLQGLEGAPGWQPAMVRRLRYRGADLVVGVQLVPAQVHAARAQPEGGTPRLVLVLQRRAPVDGRRRSLLLSQRGAFTDGCGVILEINRRQLPARTGALVESSDYFDIHQLAPNR